MGTEYTKGVLPYGYSVDELGNVYSATNWRGYGVRTLKQRPNGWGYASVRISYPDGIRKNLRVHSIVAASFLPKRPSPKHQIRHIDGNRSNPKADNLIWGTAKDNAADRERHGRTARGPQLSAAIKEGKRNGKV